jgi:hypothetical protein
MSIQEATCLRVFVTFELYSPEESQVDYALLSVYRYDVDHEKEPLFVVIRTDEGYKSHWTEVALGNGEYILSFEGMGRSSTAYLDRMETIAGGCSSASGLVVVCQCNK